MTEHTLTCAECDELFAAYFEGDLDAPRHAIVESHAAGCARCQRLIDEIQEIRREARALPDLVPSRDLWRGIEERIQPRVVSIGDRRERIWLSRGILGVAAAALVVVSSSITYVVSRPTPARTKQPHTVAESPRENPGRGAIAKTAAPPEGTAAQPTPAQRSITLPSAARVQPSGSSVSPVAVSPPRNGTSLASAARGPASPAELTLAPEIAQLQQMLKQRRNELDPSTVKVVEDNLALIDAAVKQARAALMRDPASGFLTDQLDNALHKKVELLRTVALLPSRT